jgi:hypothetical protein
MPKLNQGNVKIKVVCVRAKPDRFVIEKIKYFVINRASKFSKRKSHRCLFLILELIE